MHGLRSGGIVVKHNNFRLGIHGFLEGSRIFGEIMKLNQVSSSVASLCHCLILLNRLSRFKFARIEQRFNSIPSILWMLLVLLLLTGQGQPLMLCNFAVLVAALRQLRRCEFGSIDALRCWARITAVNGKSFISVSAIRCGGPGVAIARLQNCLQKKTLLVRLRTELIFKKRQKNLSY